MLAIASVAFFGVVVNHPPDPRMVRHRGGAMPNYEIDAPARREDVGVIFRSSPSRLRASWRRRRCWRLWTTPSSRSADRVFESEPVVREV